MRSIQLFLRSRINSVGFAWQGIVCFFKQEPNAAIHLVFTLAVFGAAVFFRVAAAEMIALLIVTAMVWTAEIFNSAIERIMDFISTEKSRDIKFIKDLAASAVLIAAIAAFITGLIVFIPKLIQHASKAY